MRPYSSVKLLSKLTLWGICVAALNAAPQTPELLSGSRLHNVAGAGPSFAPFISADGRYVTFVSHANDLVSNDNGKPYLDVFVHDLVTGTTTLASVDASGAGGGDADSPGACLSGNGRFVAFSSAAGNLISGDTNKSGDIFLRDLETGVTSLISVGADGSLASSATHVGIIGPYLIVRPWLSANPALSTNGQWVAFDSTATNLVRIKDTNQTTDVFLRDRASGVTRLISGDPTGEGTGNAQSTLAGLAADGRRVAFISRASNPFTGVVNIRSDLYVYDVQSRQTTWVSMDAEKLLINSGLPGNPQRYQCHSASISGGGEVIAFKVSPTGAASGLVFHFDIATTNTTLLASNSPVTTSPSLSSDGHWVAFEEGTNVFVRNMISGSTQLVSASFDGTHPANGPSKAPVLAADGRSVVFLSAATDLLTNADFAPDGNYQICVRDLTQGRLQILTAKPGGAAKRRVNHDMTQVSISWDGTKIAFESTSPELVDGDRNRESDVFVYDTTSGETKLVSRRSDSVASFTTARQTRIAPDCLSADGRFLLMSSLQNDLPSADPCCETLAVLKLAGGTEDVIGVLGNLRLKERILSVDGFQVAYITQNLAAVPVEEILINNRATSNSRSANLEPDGSGRLDGAFSGLTLSSDGKLLAFLRWAPGSATRSVYLFDQNSGTTRLITHEAGQPSLPAPGFSSPPRFSPDGRWLVFASDSTNLTAEQKSGVFTYEPAEGQLRMLARPFNAAYSNCPVRFSADSRRVVFAPGDRGVAVHDFIEGTDHVVGTNSSLHPTLNGDGSIVAYEEFDGKVWNAIVKNLEAKTTREISRDLAAGIARHDRSLGPLLTRDGRFVIFSSRARNVVSQDHNDLSDLFVYDLLTRTNILLTVQADGRSAGNGFSGSAVLGPDGRSVLFQSSADDLTSGDHNFRSDVFVARFGSLDSDGDGMDDDWELAYFDTLTRDGLEDFDGDGSSDGDEFRAGTNPVNNGSVLRVTTVQSLASGVTTLVWNATPGRIYQAQFKNTVEDRWVNLLGEIVATGSTATQTDPGSPGTQSRFYRVVQVP